MKNKKAGSVFGKPATFDEAFPEIKNIEIRIKESKPNREFCFNKSSAPGEYIEYHNPLCHGGRFYIGSVIREMISKKETNRRDSSLCKGEEKMGRRS